MKKITQQLNDEICDTLYTDNGITLFYDKILMLFKDEEFREALGEDKIETFLKGTRGDAKDKTLNLCLGYYSIKSSRPKTPCAIIKDPLIALAGIDIYSWYARKIKIDSIDVKKDYKFRISDKRTSRALGNSKNNRLYEDQFYQTFVLKKDIPKVIKKSNIPRILDIHFGIRFLLSMLIVIYLFRVIPSNQFFWLMVVIYSITNSIYFYNWYKKDFVSNIEYEIQEDCINILISEDKYIYPKSCSPSNAVSFLEIFVSSLMTIPIVIIFSAALWQWKLIFKAINSFVINEPGLVFVTSIVFIGITILFIRMQLHKRTSIINSKHSAR